MKIITYFPGSDKARILVVFLLSHGLILFNRSIGWDGYGLLNGKLENIRRNFKHDGLTEVLGILHYRMIHLTDHPVFVYNCAVFISSFFATWLSYVILKKIKFFSDSEVFWISVLIATLPYFYINLIGFPAILLYVFFLLGILLLINYKETGSILWRFASLVAFYISFYYHSHVTFYLVALMVLVYFSDRPFNLKRIILNNVDFILLPVVFVVHQKIAFALYEGPKDVNYNAVSLGSLVRLPKYLAYSFEKSFINLFQIGFGLLSKMFYFLLFLIVLPVIYFLLKKARVVVVDSTIKLFKGRPVRRSFFLLVLGIFIFLLGAFPFSLALKPTSFADNGAAYIHQCNLYAGAAIIIYTLVTIFIRSALQKAVLIGLVSCFVVASIKNILLHNQQWLKEESIMVNLRDNENIRNNRTFLVDDNAEELNASFRLQISTLNGLLRRAFNNEQTRFAITRSELGDFFTRNRNKDSLVFDNPNEQFSMKDYRTANFDLNLLIEKGKPVTGPLLLKLLALSYFNRDKFEQEVRPLVIVRALPCLECPVLKP